MLNVIVITIVMVVAGIIGAYCRFIFDKDDRIIDPLYNKNGGNPYIGARRRFLIQSIELIIPGIVASFIVPLFLSIGRSTLFTDLVKGNEDFYVNLFILFAFCLLASVSAKSFVNALAQQALKTADEAKKEAVEAKDLSAEAIDAKLSVEERGDKANLNLERVDSINNYGGTNEEKTVLSSLLNGEYVRRSITGIANETKLSKIDVRKALDSLVKRGEVIQAQSQRTGTLLYQAVLGASKPKQ